MPNWCMNNVTLRHSDPAFIQRAINAFDRGELLQEFVPCPTDVTGENGYSWRLNNWGTKWDVGGENDGLDTTDDPRCIELRFNSAWSAPIDAYGAMEVLGFEIEAHYFEPGLAFFGSYTQGVEDTIDYGSMTADQIRAEFPEHDERWCISEYLNNDSELEAA